MGNCIKKTISVLQEVDKVVSGKNNQTQGHQQHHHHHQQQQQQHPGSGHVVATSVAINNYGGDSQLFRTAHEIPAEYFDEHRSIRCRVVNVADGDSLRVQHIGANSSMPWPKSRKISTWSIAIRAYGIDTPETKKGGKPGMPFGKEAKDYTSEKLVKGDCVEIKLLSRDQYSRVVGAVQFKDRANGDEWTDLSLALITHGLAEVYRGGGEEYDGKRDLFETLEAQAKASRVGQWSIPEHQRMTAAEYKRKYH